MSRVLGIRIYQLHQWTGLCAGIFIFILGISGSILVFHNELEALEHRNLLTVKNELLVNIDN